ncbi:hypothetical protein E2I00_000945, partial [Balaenoptera physalus]
EINSDPTSIKLHSIGTLFRLQKTWENDCGYAVFDNLYCKICYGIFYGSGTEIDKQPDSKGINTTAKLYRKVGSNKPTGKQSTYKTNAKENNVEVLNNVRVQKNSSKKSRLCKTKCQFLTDFGVEIAPVSRSEADGPGKRCKKLGPHSRPLHHRYSTLTINMTSKKIIAVFGATVLQGGSVARAVLESKKYEVRALARDVTQPNAQVLQDLGAEVVKGDLNDKASVEASLKGAFMVTNFWDHFSKEKEVCQVGTTFEPFLFLLPGYSALPGRRTSVPVAAYFENFLGPWKPVEASDGEYDTLALPMGDVPMDGISVADVGEVICCIFNLPEKFVGKAVGLSTEALTVQQYADVLSKGLGKEITLEAYEKLEFPAAKEMANMCHFYQMKPDRDIKLTHRLNPKVKSFSQFISKNQSALKGI